MPDRIPVQLIPDTNEQLPGSTGQYNDVSVRVDAAGNLFVAYASHHPTNNNDTWAQIRRYAPDGTRTGEWLVIPPASYKVDGVSLAYSGADLIAVCIMHTYNLPRYRAVGAVRIPGIFAYRPGMEHEEGGPGAYAGGGGGPSPEEIDYGRIQQIVRAEVQAGAASVVQATPSQVHQAIVSDGVARTTMSPDVLYGWLAGFVRDRCYEAIRAWFEPQPKEPEKPDQPEEQKGG